MAESDDGYAEQPEGLSGLTDAEFQAELERMAQLTGSAMRRARGAAVGDGTVDAAALEAGAHSSLAEAAVGEAQLAAWVQGAISFLEGIGMDEFTLEYLSSCDLAVSHAILRDAAQMHTETAAKALELYVAYHYPEIVDHEAMQAKMLEIEDSSELWWQTPAELPVQQGERRLSILHTRPAGSQGPWHPLYAFGLTLRPTGPAVDGSEVDGYLPVAWTQVMVARPTRH